MADKPVFYSKMAYNSWRDAAFPHSFLIFYLLLKTLSFLSVSSYASDSSTLASVVSTLVAG